MPINSTEMTMIHFKNATIEIAAILRDMNMVLICDYVKTKLLSNDP